MDEGGGGDDRQGPGDGAREPELVLVGGEGEGRVLRCAACGARVTTSAARLEVGGAHQHVRTNPDGLTFRFGCFLEAEGCASRGVPSAQATWFRGFHWHVQVCARCGSHLGWLWFRGDASFYGLVLDHLT